MGNVLVKIIYDIEWKKIRDGYFMKSQKLILFFDDKQKVVGFVFTEREA